MQLHACYSIIRVICICIHIVAEDESCFMNPVDALEEVKDYSISSIGSQVIVPDMAFSCNGTITGLTVNLTESKENESINAGSHTGDKQDGDNNGDETENGEDETENDEVEGSNDGDETEEDEGVDNGNKGGEEKNDKDDKKRNTDCIKSFPSIQIWRPSNSKTLYTRVGQYTICVSDIKVHGNSTSAEVSLTANKSISFQPDDIIGYYVPASSPYSILNIHTMEGSFYSVNTNTTLEQFAVNESSIGSSIYMLPIIQVMFGK